MNGTRTNQRTHAGLLALMGVSVLWAFSFGLIKTNLAGIPSPVLAAARLLLAFLCFLPFIRTTDLALPRRLELLAIGAVQYGCMYMLLFQAFQTLQAYEVALFTLLTPVFVQLLDRERHPDTRALQRWSAVALAVAGAAVLRYREVSTPDWWIGFGLMQLANFCFAWGQVRYRRFRRSNPTAPDDPFLFAWVFAGGAMVAALGALPFIVSGQTAMPTAGQFGVILYLGVVASGLGFFFWNWGGARVRSVALLAVMNNVNIPLGVLVSILVFRESVNLLPFSAGCSLMAISILLASKRARGRDDPEKGATS